MKKFLFQSSLCVFVLFSTQACLKTRAQLRDEGEDREVSRSTAAAPVQDVHPQGNYVVEEIKDEITRLSGKIEDVERLQAEQMKEHSKDQSKEQNRELHEATTEALKKIEFRLEALERNNTALTESLSKFQESAASKDPNAIMKEAKVHYEEGKYQEVIDSLGLYVKIPKVKNLGDATFMRAESYYHLKQYKKAITEFSKISEKFSHSEHLPEALYKIGSSFEALGMKEDAKGFYQELVEKFPKSAQAKKVKKKIK